MGEFSQKASITNKGAVLLGKHVACDAFDEVRPCRVVTHAHSDHMLGLQQSLRKCKETLMTKATRDLINVMFSPLFLIQGHVKPVNYGEPTVFGEETVTLHKADHILGAAQVLVEDSEGTRIVYTGDFKTDETPILDSDILVMDATYGYPSCKRPFKKEVTKHLIELVKEGLKEGSVFIFGFHGKLQEIMQILHDAEVRAPLLAPERVFHVSRVCQQHGMRIGKLLLSEEREAQELLERNSPCIAFFHSASSGRINHDVFRISVSGWEFGLPCREISDKHYLIALSDHADFNELIEHVRRSKPKQVIIDGYRGNHAESFARELRRRFAIPTIALP